MLMGFRFRNIMGCGLWDLVGEDEKIVRNMGERESNTRCCYVHVYFIYKALRSTDLAIVRG